MQIWLWWSHGSTPRQEVDTGRHLEAYRLTSLAWEVETNRRLCVKAEGENQGPRLFLILHIRHNRHTGMHIHALKGEKDDS